MEKNIELWEKIYQWNKKNENYLIYPDEEVIRIIKKFFVPNGVKKVLDAGCGSGRHTMALLREGFNVEALDSSSAALKIAEGIASDLGGNVNFTEGNIIKLPYKDEEFDGIICWGVLHYLTDEEFGQAMSELYRVLKPGGVIGFTLRSTEDSECDLSKKDNMQVSEGFESKGIEFKYFDENDINKVFSRYNSMKYGHKTKTSFEDKKRKMAHWFIAATK
jgi:ubiquinone/menaquinone biosynthesis C-methylase UbiE